ncbi:tRNA uridine-5-carboxymethylaminomethyl(34) synthesis GTPase MnmE [Candidatus Chlamydia sanziniae]|uniref:tRNA modification GTPase MnmE n=1 Tax=Candidatus Chlamydia sanziniae TaxID=1806891 RepID=A0A1A9HUX2_9CHLA|nr:tRNA uridine-5-carboxymethylaminomethyl(34) synthesis GTPase MnmE [Candidatus Chlamydia sanziniae]ANH78635.1 GTPase and tRNA-U34 5-formylation enzyme TrmE [Candidatus Chlamydia sanziniae]
MLKNDTIAAIATPPGEGSIAIVRLSGPQAIVIADRVFSGSISDYASHTVHLGEVVFKSRPIDQVLLLVMRSPRSFTGEDVIEFQCHGGFFACSQILDALIAEGARPALPGEFSQRAFLNGKIDLIQAEAIQNLIAAENLDAFRIAQSHFQGHLSKKIQEITNLIIEALAFIEIVADFPEEEQPEMTVPKEKIRQALNIVIECIDSFDEGQRLAQGTKFILAGKPNVGKSSLLNALVQKDRAIVTDIPGTTRDILEEAWVLQGRRIRLIDTAGQRTTNNPIEKEGIQKALSAMEEAQVILWVLDATQPLEPLPNILFSKPSFLLWNKIDTVVSFPSTEISLPQFMVSAKTGAGLQELKTALGLWMQQEESGKSSKIFLISSRHHTILAEIAEHLLAAEEGLISTAPSEIIALDLRQAIQATQNLSGQEVTEKILGAIFSNFCIGK